MAARWGRSQTAEALLTLGADVMAKDCDGLSPVDHAWYYKVHLHYICTLYIILQDVSNMITRYKVFQILL
jgi:hypothetical protein